MTEDKPRAIMMFRSGMDTMEIARRLGVKEAIALKMVTVGRDRENPYLNKGVDSFPGFSEQYVITAQRTGIHHSRMNK